MGKNESDASALTVILQRILARQHVTNAENGYKQSTIKWLFTLFGDRIVRLGLKISIEHCILTDSEMGENLLVAVASYYIYVLEQNAMKMMLMRFFVFFFFSFFFIHSFVQFP